MTINMYHRLGSPIRLENIITLFRSKVTLDDTFLVHIRNRIFRTYRRREILERPIGSTGQPRHCLLFLQMPVDQADDIAFRPVSIFGCTGGTSIQGSIPVTFIRAFPRLDTFQVGKHIFRMAAGMAVTSPLDMQEMFHFLHFFLRDRFIISEHTPIPTGPDRRRINIDNITTELATADSRHTGIVQTMCQIVLLLHKGTDSTFIERTEIIRPVVFIS